MSRSTIVSLLAHVAGCSLFAWAAVGGTGNDCLAGKLDAVREDVRDGDDNESAHRQSKVRSRSKPQRVSSSLDCDDDSDGSFDDLLGTTILFSVTSPWWLPHHAVGDDFSHGTAEPSAPYAGGHNGYLVVNDPETFDARWWAARLSTEYGTNFGSLSRIGTRLIFDTSTRFGFDAEWNQWIEAAPLGDDTLATGDFNLVYRFAQHERIQFYSGVGVNWLADSARSDLGFNFTYGVDVFPVDPLVLSATMDLGSLGDASFFHFRSTAGVMVGPGELFTGYDYQRIGSVNLRGLLFGIRFWF